MQTHVWNPWFIFDELERAALAAAGSHDLPVFDIEDSQGETTLTADMPGMTDDDLELTVAGTTLTIRGQRKQKDGATVHRRRFGGPFETTFRLGEGYDLESVQARIENGVLTITIAKAATSQPRKIKLGTGAVEKVEPRQLDARVADARAPQPTA